MLIAKMLFIWIIFQAEIFVILLMLLVSKSEFVYRSARAVYEVFGL